MDPNIDFDEASRAWRENKVAIGNGEFRYKCCFISTTNIKCENKCLTNLDVCKTHKKRLSNVIVSNYNTRKKSKLILPING